MALNWSVSNVEGWEDLCYFVAPADEWTRGIKAGDRVLNPVTEALIFSTMAVDLPGITRENAGEFFARLRFIERLDGARLIRAEVDGKRPEGAAAFITEDEVLAHVGLSTNVSPLSRARWLKKFSHDLDRAALRFTEKQHKLEVSPEERIGA